MKTLEIGCGFIEKSRYANNRLSQFAADRKKLLIGISDYETVKKNTSMF